MRVSFLPSIMFVLPWLLLAAAIGFAQGDFYRLEDVQPGQRGHGLTVFHGTEPERFDVEIVGVLRGTHPGSSMIVAKLHHPLIEGGGVISGMSGSPVFLDDKLVGAIGHGWSWERYAVAGITPIGDMIGMLHEFSDGPASPTLLQAPPGPVPAAGEVEVSRAELEALGLALGADAPEQVVFSPLSSPLFVGTRDAAVIERARELFEPLGMRAVMAPVSSTALSTAAAGSFRQGSAMALTSISGDLTLAACGTVTYVEGDRFIGFGHAMFGLGPIDMAVHHGEIATIIPSMEAPFKLVNQGAEVAALRLDRRPGVAGTFAARASTVALSVAIDSREMPAPRDFRCQIWQDWRYLPSLVDVALTQALTNVARFDGPMALKFSWDITLADGRRHSRRQFLSGSSGTPRLAVDAIRNDIEALQRNAKEPLLFSAIDIRLELTAGQRRTLAVEGLSLGRAFVRPGREVEATVMLRPWREAPRREVVNVLLPIGEPAGAYRVIAADGATRGEMEAKRRAALTPPSDAISAAPALYPADTLYLLVVRDESETQLNGVPIGDLGGSVAELVSLTARSTPTTMTYPRIIAEQHLETGFQVLGNQSVPLEVREAGE